MKILLIEDDEPIVEVLKQGLEMARFAVDVEMNGREGLERAIEESYGLLILDLMLPDIDGLEICRRLRLRRNPVPILILTARDAVNERVKGLEAGADDYLVKPFEFSELLARVRALMRRDKMHRAAIIHIADLTIDSTQRSVARAGIPIHLTPKEFDLLVALARHEGVVVTREHILEHVWIKDNSFSNTVDVCIGQLRKKIDSQSNIKLIHTVHRMGYMLQRPEEQNSIKEPS